MKFISKYEKIVCKYLHWLEFQIGSSIPGFLQDFGTVNETVREGLGLTQQLKQLWKEWL